MIMYQNEWTGVRKERGGRGGGGKMIGPYAIGQDWIDANNSAHEVWPMEGWSPPNPREQQFPSPAAMIPPVQVSPPTTQKSDSQSTVYPTVGQGEFKVQLVHSMCVACFENMNRMGRMATVSCFSTTHVICYYMWVSAGVIQGHQVPGQKTERQGCPTTCVSI